MSSTSGTNANDKQLIVPLENFAYEILTDLPRLIQEHPMGVYINHLHTEYGESPARVLKAISHLETKHHVTVHKNHNNNYYILPSDYVMPYAYAELTELQRKTLQLLIDTTKRVTPQADRVQTNYAQLARLLKCSTGGIRTCIDRLVQLEYITIITPSQRGKQNELILGMGKKVSEHHLDS